MSGRFAVQHGEDLLHNAHANTQQRFVRGCTEMRRRQKVGQTQQRQAGCGRLVGEHIAGGSSQRTLRQSAVQCILVHHAAPRRIDEQRAGLCRGKLRRTYKPARRRREGYADGHNVRPGE